MSDSTSQPVRPRPQTLPQYEERGILSDVVQGSIAFGAFGGGVAGLTSAAKDLGLIGNKVVEAPAAPPLPAPSDNVGE